MGVLIEAGAYVDEASTDGCNSLMIAAENGHPEVVSVLLAAGAGVSVVDEDKHTPLMKCSFAAGYGEEPGHVQACELLLKADADLTATDVSGFTALMWAARWERRAEVAGRKERANSML